MARSFVVEQVRETFDMVGRELPAIGETAVMLTEVRARATARKPSSPILQAITVKDGRITEVRPFYRGTRATVGVSPCIAQRMSSTADSADRSRLTGRVARPGQGQLLGRCQEGSASVGTHGGALEFR
ncbi:hypothetical protein [Streptomyces sp. URMC 124]|uniref:hypothetical protein n=1 Tax=Streptomyces sp. URMC 124 TaxID=3423405 RepID=UPI003F1B8E51